MTDPASNGPDTIIHRLPCVGCDYSLLGLPRTGVCPECGLPIETSLSRSLAAMLGPSGCRSLKAGTSWLESAAAVQAIGLCLPLVVYLSLPGWIIGAWTIARLPPGSASEQHFADSARAVRRGAVLLAVAFACSAVTAGLVVWVFPGPMAGVIRTRPVFGATADAQWTIILTAGLLQAVAFGYSVHTTTAYLGSLAHHLPDARLVRQFRRARLLAPLWAVGLGLSFIVWLCVLLWSSPLLPPAIVLPMALPAWAAAVANLLTLTTWRIALAEGL